jgi:hypothetical protein
VVGGASKALGSTQSGARTAAARKRAR